jgi:hypothetical protein
VSQLTRACECVWVAQILAVFIVFVLLSLAADSFFVPSVEVISATLRLNQNVAGVRCPILLHRDRGEGAGKTHMPSTATRR